MVLSSPATVPQVDHEWPWWPVAAASPRPSSAEAQQGRRARLASRWAVQEAVQALAAAAVVSERHQAEAALLAWFAVSAALRRQPA